LKGNGRDVLLALWLWESGNPALSAGFPSWGMNRNADRHHPESANLLRTLIFTTIAFLASKGT